MAYDGIQFGSRVDQFTERKLHAKVVDNVMNYPTLISHFMRKGKPFTGKTYDVVIKVTRDTQGEFVVGLETLNSAASNTTILLSYAHTAFTQPKVSIMLESFANQGSDLSLDRFKYEEAAAESIAALAESFYLSGTGNRPNGLGNFVADSGTVGGQSRSTYSVLNATVTASGGTLTLAKMATLDDAVSASELTGEQTGLGVAGKAVWSLYESLLSPTVRAEYNSQGYPAMRVGGDGMGKRADLHGAAGFTSLSYRGFPIIKDDYAPTQTLFFLNTKYLQWMGRSVVPDEYKGQLTKVDLGTARAFEGPGADALDLPSEWNGWFYQKPQMLPNQAGTIARFWVIGQLVSTGFRRLGKLTGITSV